MHGSSGARDEGKQEGAHDQSAAVRLDPPPTPGGTLGVTPDVTPRGDALRRHMTSITLAWVLGSVWLHLTAGAPLTQMARLLGATEFQFGVLSALPFLASLLSLPASILTDFSGQRKTIFLWSLLSQRLLWIPLAIVPLLFYYQGWPNGTAVFLVMMFFMHCGQAIGSPAWVSWMADIIPARARSRYFSGRRRVGMISAIPAAIIAGWMLDRARQSGDPGDMIWTCAIVFVVAAVFGIADIVFFFFVPHKPHAAPPTARWWTSLSEPLRNREFLWFAGFVATSTFALSFMGNFVTLYLIEKLHIQNTAAQLILLVAPMAAQAAVLQAWGRASDRFGKKPLLALGGIGMVPVGLGWCFLTEQTVWACYLLTIAGAAMWAAVEIANFNLVIDMAGGRGSTSTSHRGSRSGYVAINSVVINIAGCAGGLMSGVIASALRDWQWHVEGYKTVTYFEVLFAISAVLRLLAVVVFIPRIHEPRARPAVAALMFVTGSVYNNLVSVATSPARIGLRTVRKAASIRPRRSRAQAAAASPDDALPPPAEGAQPDLTRHDPASPAAAGGSVSPDPTSPSPSSPAPRDRTPPPAR